MRFSGSPTVLRLSLGLVNLPGACGFCNGPVANHLFASQLRLLFAHAFAGAGDGSGNSAQQAVQAALLRRAGMPFGAQPHLIMTTANFPVLPPGLATGPIYAAARRLANLPVRAENAWFTTHLAALRAGRLTLKDLP